MPQDSPKKAEGRLGWLQAPKQATKRRTKPLKVAGAERIHCKSRLRSGGCSFRWRSGSSRHRLLGFFPYGVMCRQSAARGGLAPAAAAAGAPIGAMATAARESAATVFLGPGEGGVSATAAAEAVAEPAAAVSSEPVETKKQQLLHPERGHSTSHKGGCHQRRSGTACSGGEPGRECRKCH
ncbi:uncharacterized protein LOC120500651 isoform X2 [Passer montanus]|uniref:uncharacterized protein LOC120500651 isoform X2 n=1 Tax=Passer montanus TaxID=9160 RepID=UPI0019620C72|nr:uncharacterized protein LOC120500651 isoform X2 [Passer montanus]